MKKLLKKLHIYFILYKIYIPVKKIKNRKKYIIHYRNFLKLLKQDLNKKRIIYVGIPTHNNLGDQAQYYCIKKFIKDNYSSFEVIEVVDDIIFMNFKNIIKTMKRYINENDFFIFQSGYRTTDVSNFGGEYSHQMILNNFKNKVIVFPQTVNFENHYEIKKSIIAYKNNNNYLFLARDNVSYNSAIKYYNKNRVLLYPDIVTSLIGNFGQYNENKDGILLCLRNDAEKLYSEDLYNELINKLKHITKKIEVTDTNSKCNFEFDKSNVESEIKAKINYFSKFRLIITDRYHGTIFSLISNTKVIVLNSTDHKLSSGVNWFKGRYDEFVTYCDNFEDVYELSNKLYFTETKKIDKAIFKTEFYDKLKDKIDEIL